MAILFAAQTAAFPLFGLIIGVWIDRHRPRLIMILGDLSRGFLVMAIPIAALTGHLSMPLLYSVAFFHGLFTAFFDLS
jgi:MFS family permease